MENLVINESKLGIKYIPMTNNDRVNVGLGDICDQCCKDLDDKSVYIPVLNLVMCHDCSSKYLKSNKMYKEDRKYQERNIEDLFNRLK